MSVSVAKELSRTLNTQVSIGNINMGILNRIIIDNVQINDQSNHEMLIATRLAAKYEIIPLFKGKIRINSVQLFAFNIRLNKQTPHSKPNYQFIIDALSSKNKNQKPSNIDLRISSIILRRGRLSYDIFSEQQTPEKFNTSHIHLHNISATMALKVLRKDSLNCGIRKLNFDSESGFSLSRLSFKLAANTKQMLIRNFMLDMENSRIRTDDITLKYENMNAFKHFTTDVKFVFRTRPSYITLEDISAFVPPLKNFESPVNLTIDVHGTVNNCTINKLAVNAGSKLNLSLNGTLHGITDLKNAFFNIHLPTLSINSEGMDFITKNFLKNSGKVPAFLSNLGNISFNGNISGYSALISMSGLLRSSAGSLKTNMRLGHPNKSLYTYKGELDANNFDIGKMLNNPKWGQTTFHMQVDGSQQKSSRYPSAMLKGEIASLTYNNYNYNNININGLYRNGGFDGKAKIDDANGFVSLNGNFNLADKTPNFHFYANIDKIRPYNLNLTNKYKNAFFSVKVRANFTGGSLDKMIGELNIDSLSFVSPEKNYFMKSMKVTSAYEGRQKYLTLKSEMADAEIVGDFKYRTLTTSMKNIISHYLPSLIKPVRQVASNNNFKFNINIYNTEILPQIFDIPLHIGSYSHLLGSVNECSHQMHVEGYIPNMRYGNHEIQSGYILCENPSDKMHVSLRFNELRKTGAMSYSVNTLAVNDTLSTSLRWGNNAQETYSGELQTVARFLKSKDKSHMRAMMDIKPSNIIVNDTTWNVLPSQVIVDKGYVDVNNFSFSHQDRFIHINGRVSSNPTDTVKVDMQDINLSYLFAILNFDDIDFKGDVSGTTNLSTLTKKPKISANLFVRNFTLNNGPLGDGNVMASWDNEKEGVDLDAHLSEQGLSKTHVTGYIYPLKPKSGLDLTIDGEQTNLQFVHYFMSSIFDDLGGRMNGKVHLYGKFSELNLNADALANASMKIGFLNTNFILKDSLHITPTGITFKDTKVYDPEGHEGTVNGYITYKHLRDFNYRLQMNLKNILVMNTHETEDLPFYGKVYASGNTILQGGTNKGLDITAAIRTNRNTNFIYINRNTSSALNNQFISFIDKTPKRIADTLTLFNPLEDVLKNMSGDIRMNLQVEATPDATVKIIMDPVAGDYIMAHGRGNLRGEYYNKGDFKMFGNYNINDGVYKFSLQEVIRKNFNIMSGSSITFNGAPLDATLNVKASYTVNSASLTDLIPNISSIVSNQTNIKVNCIMNLTGLLPHPTINFDLELPNERDEIQTLVRNYISTDEQMNTQILYLLSIGKFYPQENTSTTQSSNMMTSVLSSTLSGQLNNILSQAINNNNWNFGTNISTGQNGWTDVELEGMLSGRLLNNRLIINGNFGYRDNPLANTNFVGDFEAQWLLTKSGNIRLKAYNETNDRYYTKTNLTTQGIGIILQKDFDKWNELFFWNRWKLKSLKSISKKKAKTDSLQNSTVNKK